MGVAAHRMPATTRRGHVILSQDVDSRYVSAMAARQEHCRSWTSEVFVSDEGDVPFERFVGALSDFKSVALCHKALERDGQIPIMALGRMTLEA